MRYSFLLPYVETEGRPEAFYKTAESLVHWYRERKDIEICLVLDISSHVPVEALDLLWPEFSVRVEHARQWTKCSAHAINQASRMATGERLVLTSPEVMHNMDVLSELDKHFDVDPRGYYICSVVEVDKNLHPVHWLQHSIHNPRCLHFLSCMAVDTWHKVVGGFDERYSRGIAYEDNDFYQRVKKAGVRIEQIDAKNAHAIHLWHSRDYQKIDGPSWIKNRQLYTQTWESSHAA